MTLLSIPVNDIDASGVTVDAALPVSWLDSELADANVHSAAPGHISARLSRSGKDIVVRGRIRARVTTPCARCLDPAPIEIDSELSLLLKPRPTPPGARGAASPHGRGGRASATTSNARQGAVGTKPAAQARAAATEYEFGVGEEGHDSYDGEAVVLDDFVREAVLLELPNFPLCSEACPGIRPAGPPEKGPVAGTKIDPRLAPLGALRAKLAGPAGAAAAAPKSSGRTNRARKPKSKRIMANQTKTKRKRSR
jgi:DUF177 domain-containing protein